MKIRSGFVSNSSSCSFYLRYFDKSIPFEDIAKEYEINKDLPEDIRVFVTLCIWYTIRQHEKKLKNKEEYSDEEDNSYKGDMDSEYQSPLEYYLSDSHIEWMQSNPYYKKPEGYWDKAKELLKDKDTILNFDIDSVESFNDEMSIPFDTRYGIREHSSEIFDNPSKGIAIND